MQFIHRHLALHYIGYECVAYLNKLKKERVDVAQKCNFSNIEYSQMRRKNIAMNYFYVPK